MQPIKLGANNVTKLGNCIGPAHYAICWSLDVLGELVRTLLIKPAPEHVKVAKGILLSFIHGKLSKEDCIRKLKRFFEAFCKKGDELDRLLEDFDDITLWTHIYAYQQVIKLRYLSYKHQLTVILKDSMLDGTLDFRSCSSIPIFTNGRSTPFKNPVFNMTKVEFIESQPISQQRLPSFSHCPALTTIDFSKAGLKALPGHCFSNCKRLSSVALPDLEEIGPSCFAHTAITELVLPITLRRIGGHAFDGAKHLRSIDMSGLDSLESIQNFAFRDCFSLVKLALPKLGCLLGTGIAQGCSSLKDIDLGGCELIPVCAFQSCLRLESIKIGPKQKKLGKSCFRGCYKLEDVILLARTSLLEICNTVFFETKLVAADFSKAFFTIDPRQIPCLPESLKAVLLSNDMRKLAILNPLAQKRGPRGGKPRFKATECPVSILSRDSKACRAFSDRKRYRAAVFEILGRPSWLGQRFVTGKISSDFKALFMLCCYGGHQMRPVAGIPRELWFLVLGIVSA